MAISRDEALAKIEALAKELTQSENDNEIRLAGACLFSVLGALHGLPSHIYQMSHVITEQTKTMISELTSLN